MKIFYVCLVFLSISFVAGAQQEYKTEMGTFSIKVSINETLAQARERAKQLAQKNAIEKAFGTSVSQESNMSVIDGKSHFSIVANTRIAGEIKEVVKCEYAMTTDKENGDLWLTCTIKVKVGRASPKIAIDAFALNLPDKQAKTQLFNSGDGLFVYFRSPVDGFLSIYLDDGKNISKLLPYYNDSKNKSTFPVKADKEYIFFSEKYKYGDIGAQEMELYTPVDKETNVIHCFFSESNYTKPFVSKVKRSSYEAYDPEKVTRKNFEKWVKENNRALNDFLNYPIVIIIAEK